MTQSTTSVNSRSKIEVSKTNPCPHCGKPDWCYFVPGTDANLSACKREASPATGWYATGKKDREGTALYATVASKEAWKTESKSRHKGDKGTPDKVTTYRYKLVEPSEKGNIFSSHLQGRACLSDKQLWVTRKDYKNAEKDIYQGTKASPDAPVEWRVPPEWRDYILPFRMDEVIRRCQMDFDRERQFRPMLIVEGEKCVNAAWGKGIGATCNYGGGGKGKWKESDTQHFIDAFRYQLNFKSGELEERENWQQLAADVVLTPDRDQVGLEHSVEIVKSLMAAGYPPDKIKWYFCYPDWDNLPLGHGKDIADMFEENPDLTIEDILKDLKTTEECPWLERYFSVEGADNSLPLTDEDDDLGFCDFYIDEVTTDINWTVQDLLPSGYSVVLSGQSGSGKSVSAFDLAAAVASGTTWLGKECKQGKVLILNNDQSEMVLKRMLKTRLGDDMPTRSQIAVKHGWTATDENLGKLRKWMKKYDFRLVIMDSIRECICHPLGISQNDAESGYKLKQVAEAVTAAGGCFIAIHHENKSKDSSGVEKASGSTSIISNVDAHWRIIKGMKHKLAMPKTRGYSPVEVDYQIDFSTGICNATAVSEPSATCNSNSPTIGERVVAYLEEQASIDGATRKELAEALQVKESSLREILRRLIANGSVETVENPVNPKQKLYALTVDG